MALKEGRASGDVYLSADAEVNRILLEPTNGGAIGWFVIFARNAGHTDRAVKQQTLPEALEYLWHGYPAK